MKLTLNTLKLKEMLNRAVKGASNNRLLPITGLIGIEVKDNTLTLVTTDGTNYLYIAEDVNSEDFYAVVGVDIFSKLVSKMTSENITLTLTEGGLIVKGNGSYTIELPLDENGETIVFPNPIKGLNLTPHNDIKLSSIISILAANKEALATTLENPCYTGYYVGDKVISTDSYKICANNVSLFDKPVLISTEMMNLLGIMQAEKIQVFSDGNEFVFRTPDCTVYGTKLEGIEEYAIEPITNLVNSEFDSVCKVSKKSLLEVLDRLSLFVSEYENNAIVLTFTEDGVLCSSKKANAKELIPYEENNNFKEFICSIDVNMLSSQVKAQLSDKVAIYYGKDSAIKMVDGNITQIVALQLD